MYHITHFVVPVQQSIEPIVKAMFFTRQEDPEIFFFKIGPDFKVKEIIENWAEKKEIIAFEEEIPLLYPEYDVLWMDTQTGHLWLADQYDAEKNKRLIGKYDFIKRECRQAA